MKINDNFLKLKDSYLFSTIAKKAKAYREANPGVQVTSLGIGDVTLPLVSSVIEAMHGAVDEMSKKETFRGYGPEQGYDFLRQEIVNYYKRRNVNLDASEVFVSDGAKSDLGNILDIVDSSSVSLIADPVYPAYLDVNVMNGHEVITMDGNKENGFKALPNSSYAKADVIYLCSPNNPTGAVYTYDELKQWVDFAIDSNSLILFDAAYEAFISGDFPHSIYEIPGAEKCAIEICSFSKTAGFTGTRCGYTIVPHALVLGNKTELNALWNRRQTTKFNGVPYIIQRGAQVVFSEAGQKEIKANIEYYKENARIMKEGLKAKNIWHIGGDNSPYIWLECPNNMKSWDFFDLLLEKAHVIGTPGAGFGKNGEGFFRLTAFSDREATKAAIERIIENL